MERFQTNWFESVGVGAIQNGEVWNFFQVLKLEHLHLYIIGPRRLRDTCKG